MGMPKLSSGPKLVSISAGDRAAVIAVRNKLVEENIHLVRPIAAGVARALPPSFPLDDLIGEGYTGLITAAIRYRPGAKNAAPFEIYARKRIRGAILDSIRRQKYQENTRTSVDQAREEVNQHRNLNEITSCTKAAATRPTVEISIDQARLRTRLNEAIRELPERLRDLVRMHYGEDLDLVQVADILGVHHASAWRMHAKALRELRPILRRRLLDPAA